MNRRSFLQSTAAIGVSSLVPTWFKWPEVKAPPIDLQAFCAAEPFRKFDVRKPFVQLDVCEGRNFTFATDGHIAVRVEASATMPSLPDAKLPPCAGLQWWPDEGCGAWRPWPKANYLPASESGCPQCKGFGVFPYLGHCTNCDEGYEIELKDDGTMCYTGMACTKCLGGNMGARCTHCNGNAIGIFPGIQPIQSCEIPVYISTEFDRKMRQHLSGLEYRVLDAYNQVPIQFRFEGGHGLLMVLDRHQAEKRISEAKR